VSNAEGEKPDFDELEPLDDLDMPEDVDPSADLDFTEPDFTEPDFTEPGETDGAAEQAAIGDVQFEPEVEAEEVEPQEKPKPASKLPLIVELVVFLGVCGGVLAWTYFEFADSEGLFFWSILAIFLLALVSIPFVLWKSRKTCTPYRVMLALSLAAILTAAFCLFLELKTYDYDIKAEGAKQRAQATPAVQFGPSTTSATDWPICVQFSSIAGDLVEVSGSRWIT